MTLTKGSATHLLGIQAHPACGQAPCRSCWRFTCIACVQGERGAVHSTHSREGLQPPRACAPPQNTVLCCACSVVSVVDWIRAQVAFVLCLVCVLLVVVARSLSLALAAADHGEKNMDAMKRQVRVCVCVSACVHALALEWT